jgi:hypothetical protein
MSSPPDSAGKHTSIGAKAELNAAAIARWDDEGGASRAPEPQGKHPNPAPTVDSEQEVFPALLTGLAVDEGPHSMDGMLLHARHDSENVKAFISRRVMDIWVEPIEPLGRRKSLHRVQYNALGKQNLAAIERIVTAKYARGAGFNRQHPFVDILYADIIESGETLDVGQLLRESSS